jgi:hypothetical protein
LLTNDFHADRLNPRNFSRNFRDDTGDSGQSINAERGKCFQVGLNTSASAAVGTSDAQRDGNVFS